MILVQLAQLIEASGRRAPAGLQRVGEQHRQRQQREVMRDAGLVHAQPLRDRCLRLAGLDPAADETRQVERRQAVPLLILGDQRVAIEILRADRDGHLGETGALGGTQPLRTEPDAVAASRIGGVNDDRLQQAALSDVVGEFVDFAISEFGTRVVRVLVEEVERHQQRLAGRDRLAVEQARLVGLGRLRSRSLRGKPERAHQERGCTRSMQSRVAVFG